jgi:hypothetical protein
MPAASVRALVAATKGTSVRVSALPGASSITELATAGVHSIDTLQWPLAGSAGGDMAGADTVWTTVAPRDLAVLARRLATARIALVPVMSGLLAGAFPDSIEADEFLALLPAGRREALVAKAKTVKSAEASAAKRAWTARATFLTAFARAGGRIVTGTGSDRSGIPAPGFGIHRELAALVRAGLTPAQAIRAATSNGAEMLNATNTIGAIGPGRGADFFVVTGDPLVSIADLAKIVHVVRRGEVLDPKALLARARP